jgi:hypothetical protein
MLNRRMRNLAVTGMTIVSATVLTGLFATGASATVTPNPRHAKLWAPVSFATPAAANASATTGSSATGSYICSTNGGGVNGGGLGCIDEPGHNEQVYVRYVRNIQFNLVNEETADGYAFYEIQYTGTNPPECLNLNPSTGFVGEDSCQPGDPNELFEHHYGDLLGNLAWAEDLGIDPFYTPLSTCNDAGNSRLIVFAATVPTVLPSGCSSTNPEQYNWLFIPA